MIFVSEEEWREKFYEKLSELSPSLPDNCVVTGPGRSGALASVYASHYLGRPFIPHKSSRSKEYSVLVVDTTRYTGKTITKCMSWWETSLWCTAYDDPCTIYKFWYETPSLDRGKSNDHSSFRRLAPAY